MNFVQSSPPDIADARAAYHIEEDAASQCSPQADQDWQASKASGLAGSSSKGKDSAVLHRSLSFLL